MLNQVKPLLYTTWSSLQHLRQSLRHGPSAFCRVILGGKCTKSGIERDQSGLVENTVPFEKISQIQTGIFSRMERACCFSIIIDKTRQIFGKAWGDSIWMLASYADILWARHAIFLPPRGGGRLRDEPKECLCRRLCVYLSCLSVRPSVYLSNRSFLLSAHQHVLLLVFVPSRVEKSLFTLFFCIRTASISRSFELFPTDSGYDLQCKFSLRKNLQESKSLYQF